MGYSAPGGGPESDTTAIHSNVAGEIVDIAVKGTPTAADLLMIEDSEETNAKKRISIGTLPGGDVVGPGSAVDKGLVTFSSTTGKLVADSGLRHYGASATAPTSPTPAAGDMYYDTTIARPMCYDATRSKWLSAECIQVIFHSKYWLQAGEYFQIGELYLDPTAGTTRGYQVPLAATIVGLGWAKDMSHDTSRFEILSDGVAVADISPPTGVAGNKGHDFTIDADMAANSVMAAWVQDDDTYFPVLWVHYRWKR